MLKNEMIRAFLLGGGYGTAKKFAMLFSCSYKDSMRNNRI